MGTAQVIHSLNCGGRLWPQSEVLVQPIPTLIDPFIYFSFSYPLIRQTGNVDRLLS